MTLRDFRNGVKCGVFLVFTGMLAAATIWGVVYLQHHLDHRDQPLCHADKFGWAGPEVAKAAWEQVKGEFPKFEIRGETRDTENIRVVHWDAAQFVLGEHIPHFRQLIGDCVGAGAKNAVQYLMANQSFLNPDFHYRDIYSPYHYAIGRNAPECGNGRLGRDPSGSIGSWQAVALKKYGVIPSDLPGLEPYSERVISSWAVRMPEQRWVDVGRTHLIQTVSKVTSAAQVREAICNGYPCTIASNWGGMMKPPVIDGRLVNRRSDSWAHQMCVIGYDGTIPGKRYYYILNSWGPNAHGPPPDGAPPGGFWVEEQDIEHIVRQDDSFALSQFDGFPANDWVIIRSQRRK